MVKMTEEQKKMVEDNEKLIWGFYHSFLRPKYGELLLEDWLGICGEALCKAVINFDSNKGSLGTLAYRVMKNSYHEEIRKLNTQGRRNKMGEIRLQDTIKCQHEKMRQEELIGKEDNGFIKIENKELFSKFYSLLTYREEKVLEKLNEGYREYQIAKIFGCSRSRINSIKKNIRKKMEENGLCPTIIEST